MLKAAEPMRAVAKAGIETFERNMDSDGKSKREKCMVIDACM